jgi:hypothetical protein
MQGLVILNYESWYVVKRRDYAFLHDHQYRGKVISNPNASQGAIIETQELGYQNPEHLSLVYPVDPQQLTDVRQRLWYHNVDVPIVF